MADNFNIYEWKYNQLIESTITEDSKVENLIDEIIEGISGYLADDVSKDDKFLRGTLRTIIGSQYMNESKKKVDEALDPGDEVIKISNADFIKILDRVESEVPLDKREDAYYDEDGLVFDQIADYAMNEVPENKVFYMSLQKVIDGFEDRFKKRLIITGKSPEDLQTKHEFAGDFGYTYDKLDKADLDEEKPGLWANIRAKRARGEKPAHKNSNAYKDAVKAGKKINKGK